MPNPGRVLSTAHIPHLDGGPTVLLIVASCSGAPGETASASGSLPLLPCPTVYIGDRGGGKLVVRGSVSVIVFSLPFRKIRCMILDTFISHSQIQLFFAGTRGDDAYGGP